MKLIVTTKNKITKDESGENVPHLKLLKWYYWYIVILLITIISKMQESCMHLLLINHLVNY